MSAIATAKKRITAFVKELAPLLEPLARMGYVAKGIVYMMIGVMAGLFALGRRNRPGDFSTVLLQSLHEPFGEVLLALLTLGLLGYGVWCLIQAILDTEKKGTTIFGIVTRGFYAGVGCVYLAIGWSAIQLLTRTSTVREGDQPEQEWTARVMFQSPRQCR